jgi:hypothetical protein
MSDKQATEEMATLLLQAVLSDSFQVDYWPAFPRSDGTTFSWFQVVFAVANSAQDLRLFVHDKMAKILEAVAMLKDVQRADRVTLRCRRRMPDANRPVMFIEAEWTGDVVANLAHSGNYSHCLKVNRRYANRFDDSDCFNTRSNTEN